MAVCRFACLDSAFRDAQAEGRLGRGSSATARFRVTLYHSYRPELYYMRGPGPRWRAKRGLGAPQ
jgi:hypothetical protein